MSVYFIREGDDGPIKIGCTAGNPHARLAALQTGNPRRLELLACIPGGARAEAALHERFASLRLQGEWFEPAARLLDLVETLRLVHPPGAWVQMAHRPADVRGFTPDQLWAIRGFIDAADDQEHLGAILRRLRNKEDVAIDEIDVAIRRAERAVEVLGEPGSVTADAYRCVFDEDDRPHLVRVLALLKGKLVGKEADDMGTPLQ